MFREPPRDRGRELTASTVGIPVILSLGGALDQGPRQSADREVERVAAIERYITRTVSPGRRTLLRIRTGPSADLGICEKTQLDRHLSPPLVTPVDPYTPPDRARIAHETAMAREWFESESGPSSPTSGFRRWRWRMAHDLPTSKGRLAQLFPECRTLQHCRARENCMRPEPGTSVAVQMVSDVKMKRLNNSRQNWLDRTGLTR
jgi:hypothetical protein